MKVYLIRSEEISRSRFATIVDIVRKKKGPVEFIPSRDDTTTDEEQENDIQKNFVPQVLRWEELFRHCEEFRKDNPNVKEADYVIFFTDNHNDQGWFSSMDLNGAYNFFISTSGWSAFIESDECYPIVYELATIPLMIATCGTIQEVEAMAHYDPPHGDGPRGCPWDFCQKKSDVKLRIRTGDICPDCRKKMIEKKVDPALIRQVFAIMDDLRDQMIYNHRFAFIKQLSRIEVHKFSRKIYFTDIGISVHFPAREMAFYLFFLKHPEGIEFRDLPGKHEKEIKDYYQFICGDTVSARINSTVFAMVNPKTNERSVLVTKINERITAVVGKEIAKHYIINRRPQKIKDGRKGIEHDHYIGLDRSLVTYIDGMPK